MNNIEVIDALRHEIVLRRRHRGLSRQMVAGFAGVAESSIANIENGKHFLEENDSAGNTFKALVVPQTVAQADDFITLAIEGEEFRMPKGFTFASGKRHTFTVTVRKLSSGINIDISGWEDDGTDHGGVAE